MRNILDEILEHKRREVAERREITPVSSLEKGAYFSRGTVSLSRELRRVDKVGIIAEIKRKSPSKGVLNAHISVEELATGYEEAGASALSVLTDTRFFGGTSDDLLAARRVATCPILRKDFVVSEYQLVEAKSLGADAILLIAAALTPEEVRGFATAAASLGLESLLEVHSEAELRSHGCDEVQAIGVNSRDLRTFSVDLKIAEKLIRQIPSDIVAVAESGIHDAESLLSLKDVGYRGFLIGEAFMRQSKPEDACRALIDEVHQRSGDIQGVEVHG
jgi:indole-3-glycerol phosphate synthase